MALRCNALGPDRQALGADSIGSKRGINLLEFIIQKSINLDFSPPLSESSAPTLGVSRKVCTHTHTHPSLLGTHNGG